MNSAILMLDQTAARFSNKIALQDENGVMTFAELRRQALCAATGIIHAEPLRDGLLPVIVYLPKCSQAVVCYAAAMYSGNPYVPVDSNIPVQRLQKIADNMQRGHIITNKALAQNLEGMALQGFQVHLVDELVAVAPDEAAVDARVAAVMDCDPIYIMYTSGSTGTPKGVTIPHRGIIDYACWLRDTFGFDETTVLGNQAAFYFDNSTLDIFTMMLTGAKVVLIPEVLFLYPSKLPEFLRDNDINTIFWVPTVMIGVANSGALAQGALPSLQKVLFCGEEMPNKQLNIWRAALPNVLYANLYGPTEITDVCTCYIVDRTFDDTDPLPIGRACRNMRTVVLTEDNKCAAVGEIGELCVLGSALALGYWNAPELTSAAFTQNPLCAAYDERLYRTGDLAYVADDGNLMFVGRKDSQIKLRGNRIELGEIETAAKSRAEIANACVLFDAVKQEIVLFVECESELNLRKLNLEFKQLMPAYMLPGRLVQMDKLPLTPNGKIDRVLLKQTYLAQA